MGEQLTAGEAIDGRADQIADAGLAEECDRKEDRSCSTLLLAIRCAFGGSDSPFRPGTRQPSSATRQQRPWLRKIIKTQLLYCRGESARRLKNGLWATFSQNGPPRTSMRGRGVSSVLTRENGQSGSLIGSTNARIPPFLTADEECCSVAALPA
jgi:hypothetical protein